MAMSLHPFGNTGRGCQKIEIALTKGILLRSKHCFSSREHKNCDSAFTHGHEADLIFDTFSAVKNKTIVHRHVLLLKIER